MFFLAQLVDNVIVNKFELGGPEVTIGRHPNSMIHINDSAVSGSHAIVTIEKNRYYNGAYDIYLEDNNSTNGSYINGRSVVGRQRITNNDVIRFAWNEFKLIDTSSNFLDDTEHLIQ